MTILVLEGGIFLTLVLLTLCVAIREKQWSRERRSYVEALTRIKTAVEAAQGQTQRALEDLHVLRGVLIERHVLDETDLARGKARLIDSPRRQAAEREAILRQHDVHPTQVVISDSNRNLH